MRTLVLIVLFAAMLAALITSCAVRKDGCPASYSNGIMKGKFTK